jgi:hypothetical protein
MPNYKLLFIEKDKTYYDMYKAKNFEHVENETQASQAIEKLDTDVIVFNNDNEIDEIGNTLGQRLYKKLALKKELPLFIAYTSSNFLQKRYKWMESFADAVYESHNMTSVDIEREITAFLRRRDRISNKDGLITRDDKNGVIYFGRHTLKTLKKKPKVEDGKLVVNPTTPTQQENEILKFFLDNKGEAKEARKNTDTFPKEKMKVKEGQDPKLRDKIIQTGDNAGRLVADAKTSEIINRWRWGIAHVLIKNFSFGEDEKNIKSAIKLANEILQTLTKPKPTKYKYNNKITEKDIPSYKESKYNKETSLVSKDKG